MTTPAEQFELDQAAEGDAWGVAEIERMEHALDIEVPDDVPPHDETA